MEASDIGVVVVLAAGLGSRLRGHHDLPKPLLPVGGRPLVARVLDAFAAAGVRESVVVVGHRADEVRSGIEDARPMIDVRFVTNPRYEMKNGLSVLAAREATSGRGFFLSMSDHVFEPSLVETLRKTAVPDRGLALAVDRKLGEIFDMDDATKVLTEGDRIVAIGKDLAKFDAVDTGLFACTPGLLDALDAAAEADPAGDCSLSDGVRILAASGLAAARDVGTGRWQDVDTPGAAERAARLFG